MGDSYSVTGSAVIRSQVPLQFLTAIIIQHPLNIGHYPFFIPHHMVKAQIGFLSQDPLQSKFRLKGQQGRTSRAIDEHEEVFGVLSVVELQDQTPH